MKSISLAKYLKKAILLTLTLSFGALLAQEETKNKKTSISGTVDTYYRTNLTTTDREINNTTIAPLTSFAEETGFALGMANIIASYEGKKVGAVADIVFGPRGESAITGLNLNQLYAYWNISQDVKLTAGRFNTFLGYEVISPTLNFNYSTSHLFSSGPFSHTGLKIDLELSKDFSFMLAFMNVTDVDNNVTGQYSLGAQFGYSGQFLNLYYDDKANLGFEIDYTGGFDITDSFYLGINAAYADNEGEGFSGAALYPQLISSKNCTIGLRGEYYTTHSNSLDDNPSVFAVTLTNSITIDNKLIIKPEIRLDSWSNSEPFVDHDGKISKSLSNFLIAAIFSF